ncbi:Carbon-nitrogen hydrolase [Bachmanniomyces sp. S44760]|nr:Carbon-nitrogen hydrolase [Bachmanniomyces sp. S44760]
MAYNLNQCRSLVRQAVEAGAQALFLPEASDYITSTPKEMTTLVQNLETSEFVKGLQYEACSANLLICVGVHEPVEDAMKVKNTLIWINGAGNITQKYQKLHLFDVTIQGGPMMMESENVEQGLSILPPFETPVGRVGLTICFDLRFPEISLALKRQNCQIIAFPSAFTVHTGKAHWEILLRARAIETQCYVVAAAQVGQHNENRQSYGHSMIISPWGQVLTELVGDNQEPTIATADVDLCLLERLRSEMPLLRRT